MQRTQTKETENVHTDTLATKTTDESKKSDEELSHEISNDIETETTVQNEFEVAVTDIEAFSKELDVQLSTLPLYKDKVKISVPTDHIPKLKGENGFVIDFESNDLKPMPESGVDELLARFRKNTQPKTNASDTNTQDFRFAKSVDNQKI